MELHSPFREYLQNELAKRAKKNPRFSIRAFARVLKIEPSSLAQILGGKRTLTRAMCLRLSDSLGLSPTKLNSLLKQSAAINPSTPSFSGFKRIQEDAFRVIADWHYYAILELTRLDSFKSDINWIARALGVSTAETSAAVERLKRLGYLKVDSRGRWIDTLGSAVNPGNERTEVAFREHQRQLLKKAIDALEEVPYDERVQSSMVLVGSRERIAEAKRRILNFIEELDEYMKAGEKPDDIYSITVSLIPLSKTPRSSL